MNKEFFGKVFNGPHLNAEKIINTGGVYIITPIIQTGGVHILDIGQSKDLFCELNNQKMIDFWQTLSRNFGGFAFFVHYELNEFSRIELICRFQEKFYLPKPQTSQPKFAFYYQ